MKRLTKIEKARIDFAAAEDAMIKADTNVNIANSEIQIAMGKMQQALDRQNKGRIAYRHALINFFQAMEDGFENA